MCKKKTSTLFKYLFKIMIMKRYQRHKSIKYGSKKNYD